MEGDMVRMKKRVICLLLAIVFMLGICGTAMAASENELSALVDGSAKYMLNAVKELQFGTIGGEWAVLGLARSGYSVPQEYWDNYYAAVEEYVKACGGVLHKKKYTEYSRLVVALTAIGADPSNVAGYDLLKPLGDFDKTIWQGINGPIWALIAFDSGNYDIPVNAEANTQACHPPGNGCSRGRSCRCKNPRQTDGSHSGYDRPSGTVHEYRQNRRQIPEPSPA